MTENEIDRIPKLLFPLYTAEMQLNNFGDEEEKEFGIKYEWKKCDRCGSHALYVKEALANKNQKKLDKDYEGVPLLIDLEFVCAECGNNCGGTIQNKYFLESERGGIKNDE